MTKHVAALEGEPFEIKSEADGQHEPAGDVAEQVAAALEGIRSDLGARLAALETKAEATDRRLSRPAIVTTPAAPVDTAALEMKAFETFVRSRGRDDVELKALTISAPGTGGVLAPPSIASGIIEKLVEQSPVRAAGANAVPMSGAALDLPRLVDDAEPGMVTETGPRPEDEPGFDKVTLTPFEMAVIVPVSKTMLEDSAFALGGFISARLAKKFGAKEARQFVVGNGATEAEGILTSADVGQLQTSTSAKIVADDLIDLFYSLPSYYSGRGVWLMNRQTIATVRKLRNSVGDLLWEPALTAGSPGTLLGARVFEAPDMPNIAAGAFPIAFGDLNSAYTIGDRINLEVELDTVTGWSTGLTKILARRRVGGRVVLGEALTKLKIKA